MHLSAPHVSAWCLPAGAKRLRTCKSSELNPRVCTIVAPCIALHQPSASNNFPHRKIPRVPVPDDTHLTMPLRPPDALPLGVELYLCNTALRLLAILCSDLGLSVIKSSVYANVIQVVLVRFASCERRVCWYLDLAGGAVKLEAARHPRPLPCLPTSSLWCVPLEQPSADAEKRGIHLHGAAEWCLLSSCAARRSGVNVSTAQLTQPAHTAGSVRHPRA